MTSREAARISGVAHTTITNWIKHGLLKARLRTIDNGCRKWYDINEDDLKELLKRKGEGHMRASIYKLNVAEAAKIAEVSTTTIRSWIDRGELKATVCGGGDKRTIFEIDEDDLQECLSEREDRLNGNPKTLPTVIPKASLPKSRTSEPTVKLFKETSPNKDLNYLKNKILDDQKKNAISLKIISEIQFAEEYRYNLMALAQDCNDMDSETYRQAYNKLLKTRFCCE